MSYKKDINHRIGFASDEYSRILSTFLPSDSISGYKSRKLAQAYRIYCYYIEVSTGSKQRGTAMYQR